jgi:DNA-binding transcriptional MerR regulator
MREEALLRIGEVARPGQVSIATLRHYDQFGLLKPAMLDSHTGYRYYSLAQLPCLHRIMTLKDLGFPLPEIARLLDQNLSLEQLQTFFQLKQAHIQEVIALEQARLARVAARLRQIEQEGSMPAYEMLLQKVEPLLVATIRK